MSKKRGTELSSVECIEEIGRLVRHAAEPAIPGEKVPHAIARAARRLGWERGRVSSYWYGKVRRADASELERARAVAAENSKEARLLRDEYRRAVEILARLEARLTRTDEDFFSPEIAALRDQGGKGTRARSPRGTDGG